jgi:hypothetical protein
MTELLHMSVFRPTQFPTVFPKVLTTSLTSQQPVTPLQQLTLTVKSPFGVTFPMASTKFLK